MNRRTVGLLVAGWLLGLLTAFVSPVLTSQRQTLVIDRQDVVERLARWTRTGWIVSSTSIVDTGAIVQMERPRYLAAEEQLEEWADAFGNYAQRLRYAVRSSHCGAGRPASSVEVRTTPERNSSGNRYAIAWTIKNDCDSVVIVNGATISAFRLDNSPVFTFETGAWVWIEAGAIGRGQTDSPGYWSAEHPARIDVQLRYGYTR